MANNHHDSNTHMYAGESHDMGRTGEKRKNSVPVVADLCQTRSILMCLDNPSCNKSTSAVFLWVLGNSLYAAIEILDIFIRKLLFLNVGNRFFEPLLAVPESRQTSEQDLI